MNPSPPKVMDQTNEEAIASLQQQILGHFPTREDIKTALDSMQLQLDQRFGDEKKVTDALFAEREKLLAAALGERDKAVAVLDGHLRETVKVGDESLRQHISNQIEQISSALASAEKLETSRFTTLEDKLDDLNRNGHLQIEARIASVQREVALVNSASEKAIEKAESSNADKFKAANGYREQFQAMATTLMPRSESLAMHVATAEKLTELTDRINRTEGRGTGLNQSWGYIVAGVGAIGTIVVIMVALFAWVGSFNSGQKENTEFRKQAAPIIERGNNQ